MNPIKLISYNAQNGIATRNYRQYLTGGWKHVLPYRQRMLNLDQIAPVLSCADIVALQEVDAGSFRSYQKNQTKYLAEQAGFDYFYSQTNRDIGRLAQHSSGVMSRLMPDQVLEYKLPGMIPGRGALVIRYNIDSQSFYVVVLHLSLTQRARLRQFAFMAELLQEYRFAAVMGDFNCVSSSSEMQWLFKHSHLLEPAKDFMTFPSWSPKKNIDHILITSGINICDARVIDFQLSDHLPIMVEISLPQVVSAARVTTTEA